MSVSGTAALRWTESVVTVVAVIFGAASLAQPLLVMAGSAAEPDVVAIFLVSMTALGAVRAVEGRVLHRLRVAGVRVQATIVDVADIGERDGSSMEITYRYGVHGHVRTGYREFDQVDSRFHSGDEIQIVYDPGWTSVSGWVRSAGSRRKPGRSAPRPDK